MKPVVKLHRFDPETIFRWKKVKSENEVIKTSKRNKIPDKKSTIISGRFYCDLCSNWFPAKGSLKKHMYCHRSSVQNSTKNLNQLDVGKACPFCFKKVDPKKFRNHVSNHKQLLNKRSCPTCGLEITNTHLKSHILSHEQFKCRKCKKVLKSQNEWKS